MAIWRVERYGAANELGRSGQLIHGGAKRPF
jgi:hypothetical protein